MAPEYEAKKWGRIKSSPKFTTYVYLNALLCKLLQSFVIVCNLLQLSER